MSKRVVVTGMGVVSPLGCGTQAVWRRLLAGASGVTALAPEVCEGIGAKVAARVPGIEEDLAAGFDVDGLLTPQLRRRTQRFIWFAIAAAREALAEARWFPTSLEAQERTATVIGSGIGGFPAITDAVRTIDTRGPGRLSPFTIPSFLVNLAAGQVSIESGFKGPIGAPVTACAAGLQAIGDAARLIRCGEADVALCGGSEASIDRLTIASFAAARALSTAFSLAPSTASRPFDVRRDGFVIGEGAGLLVLEELGHALARGVTPIAEVLGYATTADATHVTSGPEDGNGAARAMKLALGAAHLSPADVQHINAHATSTPAGDTAELVAIKSVFGSAGTVAVTSTKSATGHLLGAAGGVEAVFTCLALRDQVVPPTINLQQRDPAAEGVDIVAIEARPMRIEHALCNSFGFGGVNACIVLKRWPTA